MGKRGVGLLYGAPVHDDVSWVEWYEALTKEQLARLSAKGCRCTRPLRFAHIWEANRAEVAWRRLVGLALEMDVILPVGPTSWIVPNEVA